MLTFYKVCALCGATFSVMLERCPACGCKFARVRDNLDDQGEAAQEPDFQEVVRSRV